MVENAPNIAVFCDFENVAIGARDARYERIDIELVLERLLEKGKVIVKKAYADWSNFKDQRRALHEAGFELIEIPHVSYSGKNSADIRMVVDALDLCYTKSHVDLFAVISGDSDFSPLVNKLRENDKFVIGLGVKASTSDLLVENCDEFIYYDDLVRARAGGRKSGTKKKKEERTGSASKERALEMVLETTESLLGDRDGNVWGSMVKQALKRKRPNFSESYHGYSSFNQLLEDAGARGMLELEKDERSGGYIILGFGPNA